MILRAVERADLGLTLQWRNDPSARMGLRTPFPLNLDQQEAFYRDVVCNRSSAHRYWIMMDDKGVAVGMAGLTDISWENRLAEISLLTDPAKRHQGFGEAGVVAVLREAFDVMGLLTVCGECYTCNPALVFWTTMVDRYRGAGVCLPRRKWWGGHLHDGYYFTFAGEQTGRLVREAVA